MKISIAIDGPAGAGKSTIAGLIGKKFDLMYINTGAMYRAVTVLAVRNGIDFSEVERLCSLIDDAEMHFEKDKIIVNGEDLSEEIVTPETSNKVSNYAAIAEVRKKLVEQQQKIAQKYNVIMDGRDIGTVVLKDATFKFFLTASPEERAKRRYSELITKNNKVSFQEILNDIIRRDYIDSNRKVSPLIKAKDAIEIDTSFKNIDQVVTEICSIIERKLSNE